MGPIYKRAEYVPQGLSSLVEEEGSAEPFSQWVQGTKAATFSKWTEKMMRPKNPQLTNQKKTQNK